MKTRKEKKVIKNNQIYECHNVLRCTLVLDVNCLMHKLCIQPAPPAPYDLAFNIFFIVYIYLYIHCCFHFLLCSLIYFFQVPTRHTRLDVCMNITNHIKYVTRK